MTWPVIAPADLPAAPSDDRLVLAPLGPEHNERDHAAWMSSIDHIRATPGVGAGDWGNDRWPYEMSLGQNLGDLEMHRGEFERGEAYAYTVLDHDGDDVIGCVYVDPDDSGTADVMVRSWVRASHAELDEHLAAIVDRWLRTRWPVDSVRWPGRTITR
jgi:hypothetical protein